MARADHLAPGPRLVPQPASGRDAPLPEAAAADEPCLPLLRPVRLRPGALEQPRLREERAQAAGRAARLLLPHADALRLGGGVPRRRGRTARRAAGCCRRCSRACAARTSPERPASTCSWRTRPTSPSGSAATTAARPRSSTRRCTSSTTSAIERRPEDYYLAFGRVVPYKRVDLAVAACAARGARLKVAGDGRALDAVRAQAGGAEGIEFLGKVVRRRARRAPCRRAGAAVPGRGGLRDRAGRGPGGGRAGDRLRRRRRARDRPGRASRGRCSPSRTRPGWRARSSASRRWPSRSVRSARTPRASRASASAGSSRA